MTLWPEMMKPRLDDNQVAFLGQVVMIAEQSGETFVALAWTTAEAVYAELGWARTGHDPVHLAKSLERLGFLNVRASLGGPVRVRPTYRGIVRATKSVATEWQRRLTDMVNEWETATVEFKRELDLGSPSKHAEFAHDVIALANTKASGRERFLVLGYDPRSREFNMTVSPKLSQDSLENLLNEYADPAPSIRYFTVEHDSGSGAVGVIEIGRDPTRLPHRLRRDGGKRHAMEIFVRHGSHIEQPTADELAALIAEGERARALAAV